MLPTVRVYPIIEDFFSTLHSPAIKWFLNVCIALSALFALWFLARTNWYFMSVVAIVSFKAVDASLSMKCKPGWIPRLLNYLVKYMKYLIISLSLIFLIYVVRVLLKSYIYIT